jgi:hypothetical protein
MKEVAAEAGKAGLISTETPSLPWLKTSPGKRQLRQQPQYFQCLGPIKAYTVGLTPHP